jgi:very-short-patch-repair endonuclease
VTTIEQTILDMASVVRSDKAYRRVVREALVQDLITYEELVAFADQNAGARGVKRLRRELETPARTRSQLEDDVLDELRRQGLDPGQNVGVHGVEVDLFFADQGLVIEVDRPVHDNPLAQADDARRQAFLEARGLRVLRVAQR